MYTDTRVQRMKTLLVLLAPPPHSLNYIHAPSHLVSIVLGTDPEPCAWQASTLLTEIHSQTTLHFKVKISEIAMHAYILALRISRSEDGRF